MTTPPPSNPAAELTAILNDALKTTVFRTTNGQELPLEALPRAFSGAEGRTEHTQAALTAQPVIGGRRNGTANVLPTSELTGIHHGGRDRPSIQYAWLWWPADLHRLDKLLTGQSRHTNVR